jgi:hypothetical protein
LIDSWTTWPLPKTNWHPSDSTVARRYSSYFVLDVFGSKCQHSLSERSASSLTASEAAPNQLLLEDHADLLLDTIDMIRRLGFLGSSFRRLRRVGVVRFGQQ